MDQQIETPVIHNFPSSERTTVPLLPVIIGGILFILAGIITGYKLSYRETSTVTSSSPNVTTKGNSKVYGAPDEKSFRDSAEGILQVATDTEGTHKLERPGGDSQTVHLTSSILDLNQFVGKKIRIWGETFAAKKAGWFMDVGRVQIID